jgi:hypothetical protein
MKEERMKTTVVNWSARAEAAERIGDWTTARECWYRAAEQLDGNPYGLRTLYNQREDNADQRQREQIPEFIGR